MDAVERYRLYQGDCLIMLRAMANKSIANIFCDLPYGNGTKYRSYEDTKENLEKLVAAFMPEALRVGKRVIITPGNGNQHLYPKPNWTLAFVNPAGVGRSEWGFSCWQPILVYGKDPYLATGQGCRPDVFIMLHSNDILYDGHPCPKPFNVMRWIVERTTLPGELVFDPMMGQGTTGVACMQLGRPFMGCDIDPLYVSLARHYIEESAKQAILPMAAPVPATQMDLL